MRVRLAGGARNQHRSARSVGLGQSWRMSEALLRHLRMHLGVETDHYPLRVEPGCAALSVLRFEDQPCAGAITLATVGLSAPSRAWLHEELLMTCWTSELAPELPLVLEYVARQLAGGVEALIYGDVVGPAGPIVPGSALEALYACEPTYFAEGLAEFQGDNGCTTRLMWLIPIHPAEARLVMRDGADALEALLAEKDPDLLSLHRRPIMT